MCGISFILSKNKKNIIKDLLNSLELIQNRGYDSMGICYYDTNNKTFKIEKTSNSFKLYHKATNKWSSGWTYIGSFRTEEKAMTSAKLYTH